MTEKEKAHQFLLGYDIIPFCFDDIGFKRKKDKHNDDIFVKWLKSILKKYDGNNVLCLYLNQKNNDKIHEYVSPLVYLDISPSTDDSLEDDEMKIDLKKIKDER